MSRANPRKAMAAIFPAPLDCGEDVTVRPMTLGMFAALERIESPLVTGEEPKDLLELIPSLYLVTHDPREVFRGNILDLAMQWADTKSVAVVEAIRDAAYRQMNACFDVIPEMTESGPKKKNDGWIACLAHWTAANYHWSFSEIMWDVPLSAICLLRRQERIETKNDIMPLQVIEEIDDGEETQG